MEFMACHLERFRLGFAVRQLHTDLFYCGGECAYAYGHGHYFRVEMPREWLEQAREAWLQMR